MGEIPNMKSIETELERTTRLQRDAADPTASVWVSANAGTGKTHVLTTRVLRLMLAGTAPERILCLTYTKAVPRPRCRNACSTRWPNGWCCRMPISNERSGRSTSTASRPPTNWPLAYAVYARDRDAGRPQRADHPRLRRAAAAAFPARSRRGAGLHHSRRGHLAHAAAGSDRRRAQRRVAQQEQRSRQGARSRLSPMRPMTVSTRFLRKRSGFATGSMPRSRHRRRSRCSSRAVRAPLRRAQRRNAQLHLRRDRQAPFGCRSEAHARRAGRAVRRTTSGVSRASFPPHSVRQRRSIAPTSCRASSSSPTARRATSS